MAQVIGIEDERYPRLLKEIGKNAPKKLYYKGNWNDIFPASSDELASRGGENYLTVVGSRRLTTYGRRATDQIVTEIAASGVTIVSGFMYGGDEAAHSAAVRVGGKTIAVMPCGIDIIHPAYQKKLYNEILENNGLIISEYESGFLPKTWSFVQRDRIVAGLSKAVLVTEASLKSGSLLTAGYAKKYGRKVFAVPGQITSDVAKGTIQLIREGAEPVTEAQDILKYYDISFAKNKKETNKNFVCGNKLEQDIINQLGGEPMEADAIARALCVPAAKLGTTLSLMQLKGFINQDAGKYYIN